MPRSSSTTGLDTPTHETLSRFLRDVSSLPNESAKTHRFAALLGELFPRDPLLTNFAAGIEKVVHVETQTTARARRRIDAYHGNLVFEFERSLARTETVALEQLREFTAGIWSEEGPPRRTLICVASDGVNWRILRPALISSRPGRRIRASDIELTVLRSFGLTNDTLRDFWLWLTTALFGGHGRNPTAERFTYDFGATSAAFADALTTLQTTWHDVRSFPEPQLAFETWQRYLAVTYGQLGDETNRSELEELFLKHTYLATTARFLVWGALSGGRFDGNLRNEAQRILSGEFFQAHKIENLAEADFFQWARRPEAERALAPVWERMLAQVLTYSLDRLDEDVLKGVYQELVDPKDRHDLGEYYTPEWLCERIVADVLPNSGWVRVLDPTCGSGSFLRAAIAHLLKHNPTKAGQLRAVLEHVVGIDIHPLAVIIARATYVLAISDLIRQARRPVQIPVYLADSLFLPSEVRQPRFGEVRGYEIRFGGDRRVSIPEPLVRDPALFDPAIAAAAQVAVDLAAGQSETAATLQAYLRRSAPLIAEHANSASMLEALWRFTEELADLIRQQRNSIWAFIIRNAYRPAMLRGRFDHIIGNPPWLAYRFIADPEYQTEVKRRALLDYRIAPEARRLFTQMELATVFLAHSITTFGSETADLAFVMPRSVLTADQHANLRDRTYTAPLELTHYWDLRHVEPLFNVPACVLFVDKTAERPTPISTTYSLPATEWQGRLPARDLAWADAEEHLAATDATARLIRIGERHALSTSEGATEATRRSPYYSRFRQGATIVPRSCYFVTLADSGGPIDPQRLYAARTDPEQAREAKAPYRDVVMNGQVEGRFVFYTVLAKHVLPFAILQPATVVLPIAVEKAQPVIVSAEELRKAGYRDFARWMATVETIWKAKRRAKADRQTVYQRLDYQRELTSQNLGARFVVLYNHSGKDVSAVALDRTELPGPFIVDVKSYHIECEQRDEANYLAAVLNATTVNEAIKPFQSMGLLGERDVHKKVLELPIPLFDRGSALHRRLAKLGARAHGEAAVVAAGDFATKQLARRRAAVREALDETLREIDEAVQELL